MDEQPEEKIEPVTTGASRPNIPPPDLGRKEAAPGSPLDKIRESVRPPVPGPDAAVKVKVRTGDGTGGEESPASGLVPFNTRIIAMIIDWVVMMGLVLGLHFLLPGFAERLAWIVGCAYIVTRDSLPFLGGQSVGKKAMGIRAVTLDGRPLTGIWEPSLIRGGVLLIPFFPVLELFILLTREDKPERGRRLGDEWAKTKVIVEKAPVEVAEEV